MAVHHRQFTESQVALHDRTRAAAVISTEAQSYPEGSWEREFLTRLAANFVGPIDRDQADPQPRASWLEVQTWREDD